LTDSVEHLLLTDGIRNLGSLAGEIKVLSNSLGRSIAKSIVVEDIVCLVELIA
jgi:hypothetical protein